MEKTAQLGFPFIFDRKESPKATTVVFEANSPSFDEVDEVENDTASDEDNVFLYENEESTADEGVVTEDNFDTKDELETKEPEVADFSFKLPAVPGADEAEEIEVQEDEPVMDEKTGVPVDQWDWQEYCSKENGGLSKFLTWADMMFKNIPKHSGQDIAGCKRVMGYFTRLKSEIMKAVSIDYKREIDASKAEEACDEIEKGLERLDERIDKLSSKKYKRYSKKNKKASTENGITKNAETHYTGNMVANVPYLIVGFARMCIEATVQGGKDLKEAYEAVCNKFDLDDREKFQLVTLMKDMGYPMILDRFNFDGNIDNENEMSEFHKQYQA